MRLYTSGQAACTWRTGDDCWIVRGKVVRRGRVESVKSGAADVRLAGKSGTATVLVRELYWSHHAAKMAYLQAALGADDGPGPGVGTREPKPAPVVAGDGYFVVVHDTVIVNLLEGYTRQYKYIGTRDEAVAFRNGQNALTVWRILPDGAHEAALAAARREGAEAAFAAVLVAGGNLGATKDLVLRARRYVKGQAK